MCVKSLAFLYILAAAEESLAFLGLKRVSGKKYRKMIE